VKKITVSDLVTGAKRRGKVMRIITDTEGTPKSADIDIGVETFGTVNQKNLAQTPLAVGETRDFQVTLIRDDGRVNLKPC
jgi:hypothetical protein